MSISANQVDGTVLTARVSGASSLVLPPRIVSITLLASAWIGGAGHFGQVVDVEGVTENSKVDLQPSVEQLAIFHSKDIAFSTVNEDGVITVHVIGDKPTNDYTMQVTITEVKA